MALISQETVAAVKSTVDIVELVGGYFPLKRAGANFKGLCPFHEEKTPSFNVNPERQCFHCFGCGKGGDAISFVMEYERVDYPEAIRVLADRAGIPVKYTDGTAPEFSRERLFEVNAWAAGIFRSLLLKSPEAEAARRFVADRGVSDESAELFGIGFSMDSWDHLLTRGRRNGFDDRLMAAAGMLVERDGRKGQYYDRFRGRLMFPIMNAQGRIVAFGARTLKDEKPKFINSPETAIFSKGRGFYGLHLAKQTLEETGAVCIVEGYMDVIVPHQAGVKNLVATLGTSLTKDHLKVLQRHARKVILVFDADAAGQKASERGLDMLLSENVDVFVAELPAGMDPDDVVLKHGPDKLKECLEKPREIFDFLMESLVRKHGEDTPAAKARIVDEMLDRLAVVPDPVKEALLLQQLSKRFGLEERTLRKNLAPKTAQKPPPTAPPSKAEVAAMDLLACVASSPAAAPWIRLVPLGRYPTETLRRLAQAVQAVLDQTGAVDGRGLMRSLEDPALAEPAAAVLSIEVPLGDAVRRAEAAVGVLARPVLGGSDLQWLLKARAGVVS